jgi:hypothetical protein
MVMGRHKSFTQQNLVEYAVILNMNLHAGNGFLELGTLALDADMRRVVTISDLTLEGDQEPMYLWRYIIRQMAGFAKRGEASWSWWKTIKTKSRRLVTG